MMISLGAILVLIVYDSEADEYRLIEVDGKIKGNIGENETLVDEIHSDNMLDYILNIKTQYGKNCIIDIGSGDYGDYGCVIYFQVTNYTRNKNAQLIRKSSQK